VQYQVRQTPDGATVAVRAAGAVDTSTLAAEMTGALREAGLPDPRVDVEAVEGIERQASGKLKRFVSLPERAVLTELDVEVPHPARSRALITARAVTPTA
jgi:hypothetical protein